MKDENKAPSMFVLTDDYRALMELGLEGDEAFDTTLEAIKGGIIDKADQYCHVIDRIKGNIEVIKVEKNRLSNLQAVLENNVTRMKEVLRYVLESMEAAGEEPKIKTPLHTIKFHGNGGKQPIDVKKEIVPDNYKKVVLEIDNEKIRKALENGEKLPFAELKPRGRYVEIK